MHYAISTIYEAAKQDFGEASQMRNLRSRPPQKKELKNIVRECAIERSVAGSDDQHLKLCEIIV